MKQRAKDGMIVALDVDSPYRAMKLVEQLEPHAACFRIGQEFMHVMLHALLRPSVEPGQVADIRELFGILKDRVFWDGRLYDMPHVVSSASDIVARLGVKMFTVNVLGGSAMMQSAQKAAQEVQERYGFKMPIQVLGTTAFTRLEFDELMQFGFADHLPAHTPEFKMNVLIRRIAGLTKQNGLDGMVCSSHEVAVIREECGKNFSIVADDTHQVQAVPMGQKRAMTISETVRAGADFVVIGDAVTKSANPSASIQYLAHEIEGALMELV